MGTLSLPRRGAVRMPQGNSMSRWAAAVSSMVKTNRAFGFVGALLLCSAAHADPLAAAHAAYVEGRFLEAAQLAEAANTSEGYVLASECLERYGAHRADKADRKAQYERAVRLGEEAVRLDAANAWAHLQAAQALGRHAEALGRIKAAGRIGRVREGFERALALDPNMAEAAQSLGSWHAGVVEGAGGMVARLVYGATGRKAIAYFDQAIALAPELKEAHYEYAKGLLAVNPRRYRERAREALNQAIALPSRNAVDRFVHDQAVKRLAKLDG